MTDSLMSDAELMRRLGAHPELRSRMEALLLAVEDEAGELKQADAAEMRVIEEMRRTRPSCPASLGYAPSRQGLARNQARSWRMERG